MRAHTVDHPGTYRGVQVIEKRRMSRQLSCSWTYRSTLSEAQQHLQKCFCSTCLYIVPRGAPC